MEKGLILENIRKQYSSDIILDNVNCEFGKNNINLIIGRNGMGKTTLLKIILGLENMTEGKISLNNNELSYPYNKELRKRFFFMPDHPMLIEYLTGYENLQYMCEMYHTNKTKKYLSELLQKYEIYEERDRLVKFYSKGMKQKMSLMFSELYEPEILILDEPTIGLDLITIRNLEEKIKNMKHNKIVIITTHDIDFCCHIADKIFFIKEGSLFYDNAEVVKKKDYNLFRDWIMRNLEGVRNDFS